MSRGGRDDTSRLERAGDTGGVRLTRVRRSGEVRWSTGGEEETRSPTPVTGTEGGNLNDLVAGEILVKLGFGLTSEPRK